MGEGPNDEFAKGGAQRSRGEQTESERCHHPTLARYALVIREGLVEQTTNATMKELAFSREARRDGVTLVAVE